MWHLCDAWERWDQPNVELVLYADLPANLGGEMRRLAELLGFTVPDDRWEALVEAATFKSMKALAEQLAPDPKGVLKSRARFFARVALVKARPRYRASTSHAMRDALPTSRHPTWPPGCIAEHCFLTVYETF